MTNQQKLIELMSLNRELIDLLEKADAANFTSVYRDSLRSKRRKIKVWLAGNRIVTPDKPTVKRPNAIYSNKNWLNQ